MTGSHSRSRKASTRVVPIPCLKDNYAYLVICAATGDAIVVDPSEALPVERVVERAVEREGARLVRILCTHHHWDHVGGNDALSAKFRVPVVASRYDEARVPACSIGVRDRRLHGRHDVPRRMRAPL
jgi:hydroxyacylglutathione hydrolase